MKILTAEQIREIDRLTTERFGIPSLLLMENAGMRVVEVLEDRFGDVRKLTIGVICGKGNNGGDGFVVARQLLQKECFPFVYLVGPVEAVKGDARTNLDILRAIGYPPTIIESERDWSEERLELLDADVIVDALFGTGLTTPVTGLYQSIVESINEDFPNAAILSIDVPSGLPSDISAPVGAAVKADVTVTFSAPKFSLVFPPSHTFAGDVVVVDIGNPGELLESDDLEVNLVLPEDFPNAMGSREDDTNKGFYGKVLVVAGSRGKSGAAAMTGQAALRSGAGLVTVATAASVLPIIAGSMPELMTESLPETEDGTISLTALDYERFERLLEDKSLLGIGPGLGTQPETAEFVRTVVRKTAIPVILDADGLNAFAGKAEELRGAERPLILTPHPGEMARLIGQDAGTVNRNRVEVARKFAVEHALYLVLKGFRTVVACPDGCVFVNSTGNAGMATGGTGDVLTGMIAGLLAQQHLGSFVERLCLAVYLHGLAGEIAAEKLGEETMIATDVIRFLPQAWEELRGTGEANSV